MIRWFYQKQFLSLLRKMRDIYTFKAGVVEGKVVDLTQVEAIASLAVER